MLPAAFETSRAAAPHKVDGLRRGSGGHGRGNVLAGLTEPLPCHGLICLYLPRVLFALVLGADLGIRYRFVHESPKPLEHHLRLWQPFEELEACITEFYLTNYAFQRCGINNSISSLHNHLRPLNFSRERSWVASGEVPVVELDPPVSDEILDILRGEVVQVPE
jgi:hypothetical protein